VAPEWRRRGVATALVRAAEKGLQQRGCAKVNLQVRASSAAVVSFYESLGYRVEERVSMGRRLETAAAPRTWPSAGEGVERRLTELSSIETRFAITTVAEHRVLVVRYSGVYRMGCNGNPDAALMRAMGLAGVEAFSPVAVLLDLRELEYVWGDMLDQVFTLGGELPSAVLVGARCREAIGTLIFGEGDPRDPTEDEAFFDELQPALDFLCSRLDYDGVTDRCS
jgi:hypothetical protein